MRSLTILAVPIYLSLSEQYKNPYEREEATARYILNEVTHWTIKSVQMHGIMSFKPTEFSGDDNSLPFEIRLIENKKDGFWELKFGDLNTKSEEDRYGWKDEDPHKLQKALFLHDVLNKRVTKMIKDGQIKGVKFSPYDGDGLGDDRLSYFKGMFQKLNKKSEFSWYSKDGTYYVTKKAE